MLEDLAACLKNGGQILFSHQKRSQPWGAFWSHGAASIELPTWWRLSLQAPILNGDVREHRNAALSIETVTTRLRRYFLRVLYPVRTLAIIHRIKHSTDTHQQAVYNIRKSSRSYTSLAHAVISRSQTHNARKDYTTELLDTKLEIAAIRSQLEGSLDAEDWWRRREDWWGLYQKLLAKNEQLSSHQIVKMLRRLNASEHQEDAERLLALFEAVDIQSRGPIHYKFAITVALKLNDVETALYIHREAMMRIQSVTGASGILRYAVSRENWDLAIAIWQSLKRPDRAVAEHLDLWAEAKTLPFSYLVRRANSALDFAIGENRTSTLEYAFAARVFAMSLTQSCFGIKDVTINCSHWQSLLYKFNSLGNLSVMSGARRSQKLNHDALEQVLAFNERKYDQAALDAYQWIRREVSTFHIEKSMLGKLLGRCRFNQDFPIALQLIKDWQNTYGSLDLEIYRRILDRLARSGGVTSFEEVYMLYLLDYHKKPDVIVSQKLLLLYYHLADPKGAVQAFHRLEATIGFVADVECYNIIIRTFARVDDVDGARLWSDNLREAGLKPDEVTYRALMLPHSKRGDRRAVEGLLHQAASEDFEPDKALTDMLVLTNVKDEKFDEAEEVLEDATQRHFQSPKATRGPETLLTHMWNIVLGAYARRKDLSSLQRLYNRMHELGVPLDEKTYATLVTGLSATNHPALARDVVRVIMPKAGMKPNTVHYAAIMGGFLTVKEYGALFDIYRDMLAQNLLPDVSTNAVLLRAAAAADKRDTTQGAPQDGFILAQRLFDEIVANLKPSELASLKPIKYAGPLRVDEAYASSYFDYMMYLYGSSGASSHVSELFERYIKVARSFSARDVASSPPMKILSALLVYQWKAGNHEEVERCWNLALDKSEQLSRKTNLDGDSDTGWVLPARRFIINLPLQHYLLYLGGLGRFDELVHVVSDLMRYGYDLTHSNWNVYIQFLCQSPLVRHQLLAFEMCEKQLMHVWKGWEAMGSYHRVNENFRGMGRPKTPETRAPTYRTFLWLAKAYVKLGFEKRTRRQLPEVKAAKESGGFARTLDAVRNLPRRSDPEQYTILGRTGPHAQF